MLVSRSADESQLYMELEPCHACGERGFTWSDHYLETRDERLVSRYAGACDLCGNPSDFEFELREDLTAEGFAGPEPSQIIDPGQFFALARAAAESVPADPARCPSGDREDAAAAITFAVDAIEEVVKFVPAGRNAVPAEAFLTEDSRAIYATDPMGFQLDRLRVTADSYRRVRQAYLDTLA